MAKIKTVPEDFVVKEVLKVPFRERGNYRVYELTKVGLETEEAVRKIAKSSGIPSSEISYCGLKDKNAVTTQFIAVSSDKKLRQPQDKRIKLKEVGFLDRKLRPSLIKENKFSIKIRDVDLPDESRVKVIRYSFLPNYYGEQRFTSVRGEVFFAELLAKGLKEEALLYLFTPAGWEGSRDRKGKRAFLFGDYPEAIKYLVGWRRRIAEFMARGGSLRKAFSLIPRRELEFQVNVFQSFLFNEWLKEEVEKRFRQYLRFKYKVGFMFFPLEVKKGERMGGLEGRKGWEDWEGWEEVGIFHPEDSFTLYEKILKRRGLSPSLFRSISYLFQKFNRLPFIKVKDFEVKKFEFGVKLSFSLPAGSYATNIVRFLYDAV